MKKISTAISVIWTQTGNNTDYFEQTKRLSRRFVDSTIVQASLFAEERHSLVNNDIFQTMLKAELGTVQKSIDEIIKQVIADLEAGHKVGITLSARVPRGCLQSNKVQSWEQI